MGKNKIVNLALIATVLLNTPAFAGSTSLTDLEAYKNAKNITTEPGKQFDKSHWAYHSLEYLTKKYGLLLGDKSDKLSGNQPLTRNEAAVILVNLVGKIENEKTVLNEVDKNQIEIMKNEFSNELTVLTGRIEKIEEANSHTFKAKIGTNHQIAGAIQAQYTGNYGKGVDSRASNFTNPVTDITFKGTLRPHLDYNINLFPSRTFTSSANGLLGDLFVATDIVPKNKIYFGQKRKPIGLEGTQSPYTLETVERAQIARNFGDKRDMGVTVAADYGLVDYTIGLYNGSGMNTTDTANSDLEYSALASINPLGKDSKYGKLKLGGTYNHGKATTYSHDIFGAHAQYKLGKYLAQAEWSKKDGYNAKDTDASGWYVHNSYFLTKKLQLVARIDNFDKNIISGKDRLTEYTIGGNYYFFDNNLKVQCHFVVANNKAGADGKRLMLLSQYMF